MKCRGLILLGVGVVVLSSCGPATRSVTGITRSEAGELEAVVLVCEGTANMVGVETDGDRDARTDYVWETKRTKGILRLTLTRAGLEESDLLGTGDFTAEVGGYDTSHEWNSITVPITEGILDELDPGSITYGNPDWGLKLQQVSEKEFAASGCEDLQKSLDGV